ncbi:hypothetical protein NG895_17925 [Aeoliella sp. ICT_H6.2]|uniref:Uncharacterized protein n=1 Tax=Aeoliella straminimaris TaxID=2954799 RepID=A0A9X2FBF1_9BACT|nr:hypothetical protein [Aeoliella straminimaris]MCO6045780.1 hypothetical protein [Aeoliella straminimaris]
MTKTRSITIAGGAFTMAAIALVVLADLFVPLVISRATRESVLIGLSFGQMGVAVLWASSAAVLSWRRIAVCYLVAVVTALHFVFYEGRGIQVDAAAMIVTIWISLPTLVLGVNFALRWIRQYRNRYTEKGEQPPRFGVRHLLMASTAIAVVSLIVRFALPELGSANVDTIVVWVLQSTAITLVAVEVSRSKMKVLWQVGLLAIACMAGSFWLSNSIEWEDAWLANVIQTLVLAIALLAPRLDRYTMRITLEPRERETPVEPETAEDLTE